MKNDLGTVLAVAGYIRESMKLSESQMRNLPGAGKAAVSNIIATLKKVGVYLKWLKENGPQLMRRMMG